MVVPGESEVARRKTIRVLVVDDNRAAAKALQIGLSLLGCDVDIAFDAPDALAAARRTPPDVALVDIGLPGTDGCELGGLLRALGPVALIAVTGRSSDVDRARAAEAGFTHYLLKPVELQHLHRIIVGAADR